MGDTHRNRYVNGDWLAECDVCGFVFLASNLMKRWDGMMVCERDYENRHPSDLPNMPRSEKSVPWIQHPEDIIISVTGYYIADGSYYADGSIVASGGGSAVDSSPQSVVFGPADPDSL